MNDSETESEDDMLAQRFADRERRLAAIRRQNAIPVRVKTEPVLPIPILPPIVVKQEERPAFPIPILPPMASNPPEPAAEFEDSDMVDYHDMGERKMADVPAAAAAAASSSDNPLNDRIRELTARGLTNKQLKEMLVAYKGLRLPAPSKYTSSSQMIGALAALQLGLPVAEPPQKAKATPRAAAAAAAAGDESDPDEDTPITQLFGVRNVVMRGTPAEESLRADFSLEGAWYTDSAKKRELIAHWKALKARKAKKS